MLVPDDTSAVLSMARVDVAVLLDVTETFPDVPRYAPACTIASARYPDIFTAGTAVFRKIHFGRFPLLQLSRRVSQHHLYPLPGTRRSLLFRSGGDFMYSHLSPLATMTISI